MTIEERIQLHEELAETIKQQRKTLRILRDRVALLLNRLKKLEEKLEEEQK